MAEMTDASDAQASPTPKALRDAATRERIAAYRRDQGCAGEIRRIRRGPHPN